MQEATATTPNIIIDNKNDNMKYLAGGVVLLVLLVGVALWYVFVYKKQKQEKERNNTDPSTKDGKAKIYAGRIYDAFNWYNDNEAEVLSVAQQASTDGVTYKELAEAFNATRGENLDSYLSRLSNAQKTLFMQAFETQKQTQTALKTNPATLTLTDAKTLANQLDSEFARAYSSTDTVIKLLQRLQTKGDWLLLYSAFGIRTRNFRDMDLTNHIRTVYPIGKKSIFSDLNNRLKTNLN